MKSVVFALAAAVKIGALAGNPSCSAAVSVRRLPDRKHAPLAGAEVITANAWDQAQRSEAQPI
jgi:hypothetical protein